MTRLCSLPRWAKAVSVLVVACVVALGSAVVIGVLDDPMAPITVGGGPPQGTDLHVNPEGTFGFRWRHDVKPGPDVDTHVLEVVDIGSGEIVFMADGPFRARDVNWAEWSTTPNALVAYSGDVGTSLVRLTGTTWERISDVGEICVDTEPLDPEMADRLSRVACP